MASIFSTHQHPGSRLRPERNLPVAETFDNELPHILLALGQQQGALKHQGFLVHRETFEPFEP
jgi:hypothetical protein